MNKDTTPVSQSKGRCRVLYFCVRVITCECVHVIEMTMRIFKARKPGAGRSITVFEFHIDKFGFILWVTGTQ